MIARSCRVREGNGMNGDHGFSADFATTFSDIFDDLFGMGGRRGRGSGRARRRPALQHGNLAARSLFGQDCADPHCDVRHLRSLLQPWRKARHQAEGLSDVRGPRQSPACARFLHARTHLLELPGPRAGDREPLHVVLGFGPHHARAHIVGELCRQGMPGLRRRQFGDMSVQVVVETPQRQRDFCSNLSGFRRPSESFGFRGKFKDFVDGRGPGRANSA